MPIRIEWKNGSPVAECDTVAEAVEMMHAASSQNGIANPSRVKANHEGRDKGTYSTQNIAAFLQEQKPQVKLLLHGLRELGEVKADQLADASGIPSSAYGGLFGALSKATKKAGISLDGIYTTSVRFDGPRRERWYAPGPLLMEHGVGLR